MLYPNSVLDFWITKNLWVQGNVILLSIRLEFLDKANLPSLLKNSVSSIRKPCQQNCIWSCWVKTFKNSASFQKKTSIIASHMFCSLYLLFNVERFLFSSLNHSLVSHSSFELACSGNQTIFPCPMLKVPWHQTYRKLLLSFISIILMRSSLFGALKYSLINLLNVRSRHLLNSYRTVASTSSQSSFKSWNKNHRLKVQKQQLNLSPCLYQNTLSRQLFVRTTFSPKLHDRVVQTYSEAS